jgi:hypothetical protein
MLGIGRFPRPMPSIQFFRLTQRKTLNSLAGLSSHKISLIFVVAPAAKLGYPIATKRLH